jgi:hypothetical protein
MRGGSGPQYDRRKLPKWAQQELQRLEHDLASTKKEMREMMGESNEPTEVYIWDHMDLIRLPARTQIRFGDPESRNYFDVMIRDGRLRIYGGDSYVIHPGSSNTIDLSIRDRRKG